MSLVEVILPLVGLVSVGVVSAFAGWLMGVRAREDAMLEGARKARSDLAEAMLAIAASPGIGAGARTLADSIFFRLHRGEHISPDEVAAEVRNILAIRVPRRQDCADTPPTKTPRRHGVRITPA